ncbi:TD and POZ domain-containing protein 4-like [Leptopilina boulardi]|uniref:TD and POZ domain-containing protein 4-like n=1 Tax=Leptopilina boulardi TaxID=63433 RepID=UPI0021F598C9|nr:TD and POZ domain-containing protein 4-like [Leptopilina boulardi]
MEENNSSDNNNTENIENKNSNQYNNKKLPKITNFNWIIKKYKSKKQIYMRSQTFHIEGNSKMKWYLFLEKNEITSSLLRENFININLQNISLGNNFFTPMKLKLSLGSNNEKKIFTRIIKLTRIKLGATYKFYDSMKEQELIKLISPSNCFRMNLTIVPLKNNMNKSIVNNNSSSIIIEKNFESFFINTLLSDVTFKINEYEFPAHKIILVSVSSIFKEMFIETNSKDITTIIELNEIDPNVFKEMLRFIYTGRVENLENIAFDLCKLAYKYNLSDLILICEQYLQNSLSINNVIYILELANYQRAEKFKIECIKYIDENFEEIKKTESFQTLNRELLMDILCETRIKKT